MQTEVHVYALAVAASLLLSFYPFLNVMLSFCRDVLRWPAAVDAVYVAMNDYLPGDLAAFLKRNLPLRRGFQPYATRGVTLRHSRQMPQRDGWTAATPIEFSERVEPWD